MTGFAAAVSNAVATVAANAAAAALRLAQFAPYTNQVQTSPANTVWIDPTNGNYQCYALTNAADIFCPTLGGTAGQGNTIKFILYSTNSAPVYSVAASNVFNSGAMAISATTNLASVFLLDRDPDLLNTNLWVIYQLR